MNVSRRYQTFWARFWASAVDGVLFTPVYFAWVILMGPGSALPAWAFAILYVLVSFSFYAYTVFCHGRWGQTIGKMITGVRVVDVSEESALSYRQALMRDSVPLVMTLVALPEALGHILGGSYAAWLDDGMVSPLTRLLSMASWLWFLVEIVTMLSNDKRRAFHDMIAGSVVVDLKHFHALD